MSANLENSAVVTGLEKVSFHSSLKEGNAKECSNDCTIAFSSHVSKAMLKILQARLQLSKWTENFHMFKLNLGRRTRDWLLNIHWLIQRARESQKNIFCFIDYDKAFDRVDYNKLWKILQEMGIPDHLTCLQQNLCAGQEATVRTGHRIMDWFKIGKGVQ